MFDESMGIISTLYGITLHDAMGAHLSLPQDESFIRYYEVDGYLWHNVDTIVNWEVICDEGYTCKVQVTRLCDGEVVKTEALMKVTIAIPEGWDAEKTEVYYYDSKTNEVTNMKGVVSEDGTTITFTTTHFSYYSLVQKKDSGSIKTSDTSHILTWLFVLLLASICLLISALKKLKIEL